MWRVEKPVGEKKEDMGEQQSADLTSVEFGWGLVFFKYANIGSLHWIFLKDP